MVKNKAIKDYFKCFAICGALSAVFMFIVTLMGDGILLYAGDFNQQQIPFNYYIAKYLQSGGGTYSWETDIGSGFLNSYSFYTLGSPFFWIVSMVPAKWFPYLMYPLLVLKFAVMGGGVQLWAKRYFKNDTQTLIVALLYVCSGYSLVNLFFNHFLDVVALFPYMMWALDKAVLDNKKGCFAVAVAFNFLVNYFFFVGEVVFLAIYVLVNVLCETYKINAKKFFRLGFESLLGCAMGCALALPAFISLAGSPRTSALISGWEMYLYTYAQQYLAILFSAFFAPDRCFANDLWTTANVQWRSMSVYIVGFSMSGVLTYIINRKGERQDPWKNIFLFCVVAAFVPLLNSAFTFFNRSYYARWYYMPLLIMCAMTVKALDEDKDKVTSILKKIMLVAVIVFAIFAFAPTVRDGEKAYGLTGNVTTLGAIFAPTFLCGLKTLSTMRLRKTRDDKAFWSSLLSCVLFCGMLFGFIHTYLSAQYAPNAYYMPSSIDSMALEEDMPEYDVDYRMDTYSAMKSNIGLWTGISNVKAFNSTVEPSLLTFYGTLGFDRGTRLEISVQHPALYTFLNVRYTHYYNQEYRAAATSRDALLHNADKYIRDDEWETEDAYISMFQMEQTDYLDYYATMDGYNIYENKYYAGMGFVFDEYITMSEFKELTREQKEYALLKCAILADEDEERYKDYFSGKLDIENTQFTYDAFVDDATSLKAKSAYSFQTDNRGFSAKMFVPDEKVVVFSVPYSENWNIRANGEEIEYIEVDGGMMGLILPAGECDIRADYESKGAKLSFALTGIAWILFAIYFIVASFMKSAPEEEDSLKAGDPDDDITAAALAALDEMTSAQTKKDVPEQPGEPEGAEQKEEVNADASEQTEG